MVDVEPLEGWPGIAFQRVLGSFNVAFLYWPGWAPSQHGSPSTVKLFTLQLGAPRTRVHPAREKVNWLLRLCLGNHRASILLFSVNKNSDKSSASCKGRGHSLCLTVGGMQSHIVRGAGGGDLVMAIFGKYNLLHLVRPDVLSFLCGKTTRGS